MYKVQTSNGYRLFANEADAKHFQDFLKNGLKCTAKSNKTYFFNDGARLIDCTMINTQQKKYVLLKDNQRITASRRLNKYIKLIGGVEKCIHITQRNDQRHREQSRCKD